MAARQVDHLVLLIERSGLGVTHVPELSLRLPYLGYGS